MNANWQCRYAPSLGALEDTPQNVWGTDAYIDQEQPTVFFGLYGLPDFYTLWRHKGRKAILWAGSDIQHFLKGYWLDDMGVMKLRAFDLAPWIDTYCENYVENEVEQTALASVGIRSKVIQSFLGDINLPISYQQSSKPKVYTSVSGNNFKLYGWDKLPELSDKYPYIEFHCYGNTENWGSMRDNLIFHGRVPKEQMNEEIKDMQGALRLTEFDGFSEILAKSVLMGQWPVSVISYPHILSLDELGTLKDKTEPNLAGRDYYLEKLNKYPWNQKQNT